MQLKHILLAAALIGSAQAAYAQDAVPSSISEKLKISGVGRLRYENQEYTTSATNSSSFTSFRLRPNISFKASEELELVFEPQFSKRMGSEVYSDNPTAGAGSPDATRELGESSGNSGYSGDPLTVFQGYMKVNFSEAFSLKAGRQVIKYGDDLILGPANWGLYGRSFDAAILRWQNAGHFVDVIHAAVADFGTKEVGGKRHLNGVYTSWGLGTWLKNADLYYFQREDNDNADTAASDNGADNVYSVVGARLVFDFNAIGLNVEYARGDGSEVFVGSGAKADMVDALVNYKITDTHKVGLRYSYAGSDWNELYPTTNRALGRADVVGRRNIQAISLHYAGDLSDKWGLEADVYNFSRPDDKARIYRTNGTSAFGSQTSDEKDIGNEIDLAIRYKQSSALTWSVGAAYFMQGQYIKDSLADDDKKITYSYLMLEAKY